MIISADSNKYSPPEMNVVKDVKSEIPIVLVTRLDNYQFNEKLLDVKEYVLFDYCEYEWHKELTTTHIFGKNTNDFIYRFPDKEWAKFDNWVKNNPPKKYIKRELLTKDVSDWLISSTYPCYVRSYGVVSKKDFDNRPIEVFHYFGRSHESRIWFHSNAYKEDGITLVDNIYYLDDFIEEKAHKHIWCSFHIPHFARIDIEKILDRNNLSKLSLSMPGCGKTCFRHSEAPVNSVMVMQDSGIAFPFPWVDGENCIMYKGDDPIPSIKEALQRPDLYDIYVKGMVNIENYRKENYDKYLEKIING